MKTVFIYALKDPDTGQIRYVGMSENPERRFHKHLLECKREKNHRACWIRRLQQGNLRPGLAVLDEVPESEWQQWEVAYIDYFKSCGCDLVNSTPGGDGFGSGEDSPNFGKTRTFSSVHRGNLSAASAGRPKSEAHRAALALAKIGTKQPRETVIRRRMTWSVSRLLRICQTIE